MCVGGGGGGVKQTKKKKMVNLVFQTHYPILSWFTCCLCIYSIYLIPWPVDSECILLVSIVHVRRQAVPGAQREERLREARTVDIKAVSQSKDRKKRVYLFQLYSLYCTPKTEVTVL